MSRRISHNVLYLSLDDLDPRNPDLFINSPGESCYLYFQVPFQDVHFIAVQISVVPFCLAGHRDQVFSYARGVYAPCCANVRPCDFISTICDAAQNVYELCVRNHYWNFRTSSCWEQMQLGWEASPPMDDCLRTSLYYLENLTNGNINVATASPISTQSPCCSDSVVGECQAPDLLPCQPLTGTKNAAHQARKRRPTYSRRKTEPSVPAHSEAAAQEINDDCFDFNGDAAIQVADRFLDSIPNIDVSRIPTASFCLTIDTSRMDQDEPEHCAIKAWELCSEAARQASQYFGHARFIRFVSLCFFLIWENFSSKSGKASAREVNTRMREAGFEGTSRTLKSLRDETIFINQLVSSAEQMHGAEVASKLIYCIFAGSNYHYIRTVCRFGGAKRLAAVEHICKRFVAVVPREWPILTTRPQYIIKQYLSTLDINTISMAIRYKPLAFSNQLGNEGFSTQNTTSEIKEAPSNVAKGRLWRNSFSFEPSRSPRFQAVPGLMGSTDSGASDSSLSAPTSSAASIVEGSWDLELASPLSGLAIQLDEWYSNLG